MKLYFYISFLLCVFSINAQESTKSAEVFVSNNFNSETGLVVKWISNRIYFPDGTDIYRKEENSNDWVKLNTIPINLTKSSPIREKLNDEEKGLYDFAIQTSYEDLIQNVARAFLIIKAIYNHDFANLIGITYTDQTAEIGKSYSYKIIGNYAGNEIEVGITKPFLCDSYSQITPPNDIELDRKKSSCEIKWKPEIYRYYGVDIFRKTNENEYTKITKIPRAIQKIKDQKGNYKFPEICFTDTEISKDSNYTYKFIAIDYFGQKSIESNEFSVPVEDFDPPTAPFGLTPTNHDSKQTVSLKWNAIEEDDLAHFNVHRSQLLEGPYEIVNDKPLSKTKRTFLDTVPSPGHYYYYCSAKDNAGNISNSGKIYIQIRDMIPPSSPTGLKSETSPGLIVLKWAPNNENDLQGYFIQRSLNDDNNSDNHYINMNTKPLDTNYYAEKLSKNVRNKFVYRVIAVDTSYNRSKPSVNSLAQMPDVTPPSSPVIKNIEFEDDNLIVNWISNVESDMMGYNLYRKLQSDSSSYNKVNNSLIPKSLNIYTDRSTSSAKHYLYKIEAVDVNGNVSEKSNAFLGVTPKEKIITEITLTKKIENRKKRIILNWNLKNDQLPLIGYVLYKSKDENILKPYTKMITELSFSEKLFSGTYNYQIRAYTEEGSVILSEILNFTYESND